jgi:hypothetical protein
LEETELIEHTLSSSTVSAADILNAFFADSEVRRKFIYFKEQAAPRITEALWLLPGISIFMLGLILCPLFPA